MTSVPFTLNQEEKIIPNLIFSNKINTKLYNLDVIKVISIIFLFRMFKVDTKCVNFVRRNYVQTVNFLLSYNFDDLIGIFFQI